MDVIEIVYMVAVGVIAIVGLYKAYSNDNKITKEELEDIIEQIKVLLGKDDSKSE